VGDNQFIERLEKVLEQFRKHLIALKPSKCKFGMSVVEYCGKQIDQSGLSIIGYEKKTRAKTLVWTEEGTAAFYQIIKEIEKNHTMFFPREDCPIFLQTDSSDYGICAYCFQLVVNAEQPVAFVSKSLTSTQFKWAIIQKYA
jgi:hypothetical protein